MTEDKLAHDSSQDLEREILEKEYFFLQNAVEDYNRQIWIIKSLGITGSGAAAGLAVQQTQPLIALASCSIPLFFWVLEGQWKHFQRGFYPRIIELENLFEEVYNFKGPKIFHGWSSAFKRDTRSIIRRQGYVWDGLLNPSVFISYVLEICFLFLISLMDMSQLP